MVVGKRLEALNSLGLVNYLSKLFLVILEVII